MKRTKVYISVPISGRPLEEARHEADLVKRMLSIQGYDPVSPFDIWAGDGATWEDHMVADLRALMGCDAIYMCPGWAMSCGCCIEFDLVRNINTHGHKVGHRKMRVLYGR